MAVKQEIDKTPRPLTRDELEYGMIVWVFPLNPQKGVVIDGAETWTWIATEKESRVLMPPNSLYRTKNDLIRDYIHDLKQKMNEMIDDAERLLDEEN